MMDYHCAKFGHFSFSRYGFIAQTQSQRDRITHTEVDDRYTHVTTVGMSNDDGDDDDDDDNELAANSYKLTSLSWKRER